MSATYDMAVSDEKSAALFVLDLSMWYAYPAALRAAVLIGEADHLVDGPKTADEIAQATNTDRQKLYRVLRLLASRGVLKEDREGRFELPPAAELLRSDVRTHCKERSE